MHTRWKLIAGLVVALALCLARPLPAYAHGADIEYTVDMVIEITASYDNGEPMSGAQVVVYAPDDLTNPWLTGICDEEGRFSFTPDTSRPGTWDVQVRQAGHGDIVHIPVGEGSAVDDDTGSYSTLQIILMAACVIWGAVGTSLYFWKRRT